MYIKKSKAVFLATLLETHFSLFYLFVRAQIAWAIPPSSRRICASPSIYPPAAMSTNSESSSVVTAIEQMQRRTEETQPWNRMMGERRDLIWPTFYIFIWPLSRGYMACNSLDRLLMKMSCSWNNLQRCGTFKRITSLHLFNAWSLRNLDELHHISVLRNCSNWSRF